MPGAIGAKAHQILDLAIGGKQALCLRHQLPFIFFQNTRHAARYGAQHIHRRVAPGLGNRAIKHDMPIQNAAHRIGHGFIMIIAFHQHGEKCGDGTRRIIRPRPGTFQKPRQFSEDRRRIAARGRRLPHRQANFAQRQSKASHTIHQQQHLQALIAEMLGHRHGGIGGFAPERCRAIRCGTNHDTAGKLLGPQIIFDEFAQFAPAFTDKRKDNHIRRQPARQHGHEGGFAHAGSREKPKPLPAPDRGKQIKHSHPQRQPHPKAGALAGCRCRRMGWALDGAWCRHGSAIKRPAHRVQDPPKPGIGNRQGRARRQRGAHAGSEARQRPKRNRLRLAIPKARDFRHDWRARLRGDRNPVPNRGKRAEAFQRDGQPGDGVDAAMNPLTRQGAQGSSGGVEIRQHSSLLSRIGLGWVKTHARYRQAPLDSSPSSAQGSRP